jgi:hypothetical protein
VAPPISIGGKAFSANLPSRELDELPVLYTIDVVDFRRASNEFREVALSCIEPLTLHP